MTQKSVNKGPNTMSFSLLLYSDGLPGVVIMAERILLLSHMLNNDGIS